MINSNPELFSSSDSEEPYATQKISLSLILFRILGGIFVGGASLVPGVSAGTMALLFGLYFEITHGIRTFFQHPRQFFLSYFISFLSIGFGILISIFLLPSYIYLALSSVPIFFFALLLGMTLFSGIQIFSQELQSPFRASQKRMPKKILLIILLAMMITAPFTFKEWFFHSSLGKHSFQEYSSLFLLLAGFFSATFMIVPGLSGSLFLLLIGIYPALVEFLSVHPPTDLMIKSLWPLVLGGCLALFPTSYLMSKALEKFPRGTYAFILGVLLNTCILFFLLGFQPLFLDWNATWLASMLKEISPVSLTSILLQNTGGLLLGYMIQSLIEHLSPQKS